MKTTFKCLHCDAEHEVTPNDEKTGVNISLTKAGKELKESTSQPPKEKTFLEILFGSNE